MAVNRLSRIMGAYTSDSIFSIDLAGAVLRQGSFVKKMHNLRWTEPEYFEGPEDEIVLQHSVARYHACVNHGFENDCILRIVV